jgi:hypothetical protein
MPTKKKPAPSKPKSQRHPFEVIEIASKGKMLGIIHANDHDHARILAIETFGIRRPEMVKLIIRKIV